jgi:hypothetical protein
MKLIINGEKKKYLEKGITVDNNTLHINDGEMKLSTSGTRRNSTISVKFKYDKLTNSSSSDDYMI